MGKLDEEIFEAIDKSLPKLVGGQVAKRLKEADEYEAAYSAQSKKLEELTKTINETQAKLDKERAITSDIEKLRTERISLDEEKRNIKVVKAEYEAKAAWDRSNDLKELVRLVFSAPVYETHMNKTVPHKDQYGNTQYSAQTGTKTIKRRKD